MKFESGPQTNTKNRKMETTERHRQNCKCPTKAIMTGNLLDESLTAYIGSRPPLALQSDHSCQAVLPVPFYGSACVGRYMWLSRSR